MKSIFTACLATYATAAASDHWAVLVATGDDYDSQYAFQSDASMAYEVIQRQ